MQIEEWDKGDQFQQDTYQVNENTVNNNNSQNDYYQSNQYVNNRNERRRNHDFRNYNNSFNNRPYNSSRNNQRNLRNNSRYQQNNQQRRWKFNSPHPRRPRQNNVCWKFSSPSGCSRGRNCRFIHEIPDQPQPQSQPPRHIRNNNNNYNSQMTSRYVPKQNNNHNPITNANDNAQQPDTAPPIQASSQPIHTNRQRPIRANRNKRFRRKIANNMDDSDDGLDDEEQQVNNHKNNTQSHTQYVDDCNDYTSYSQPGSSQLSVASHQQSIASHRSNYGNYSDMTNLSERAKEMVTQLINGKYDCMVCQSFIGKKGRVWGCTHCFTVFHMTCINKWARIREEKESESEQRLTRPDYEIKKIRCPACSFTDTSFVFNSYSCYCKRVIFDQDLRSSFKRSRHCSIPHSCGEICGKKKGELCPHKCMALCHPGPCDPCKLPSTRKSSCPCGKLEYSLLCGQTIEQENKTNKRTCNQICDLIMKCGNHKCKKICHNGDCDECKLQINANCFCGKQENVSKKCGENILFSCNTKCNKLLNCENHRCNMICHSGSCSGCHRRVEFPTKCACGKNEFNQEKWKRKTCLDPLPKCNKKCQKMLKCGKHLCKQKCHDSKCQPCGFIIRKKCRCNASDKRYKCHAYDQNCKNYSTQFFRENANNPTALFDVDGWVKCGKKCKRVMSCGVHTCAELCCKGRTLRGVYFEAHMCRKICDKPLTCGLHKCNSFCHRGPCNPCGVTYRNGVQCACGSVYVEGPFQCGTKTIPVCKFPCDKYLDCGHLCASKCHNGNCPKCIRLCSKPCVTHDVLVHNMPCHVQNRLCGNPCGKLLKCNIHSCNRICHNGPCVKPSNNNGYNNNNNNMNVSCGQSCGLKLKCGHNCAFKCHAHSGQKCSDESCKVMISVKCSCGNTTEQQYCRGRTEYELKAVACTEQCQIAERNKQFREALNINIMSSSKTRKKQYLNNNDVYEEKQSFHAKKQRIPYAASVLKRILNWMSDDKGHNRIIKEGTQIIGPSFVFYMEKLLKYYIEDNSIDARVLKNEYKDLTILTSSTSNTVVVNLKPMNSEQRFVVFSMITHYNVKARKVEQSINKMPFLELIKTKQSMIPLYLLSTALMDYQLRSDEIETLESMPPESMLVIDDCSEISSSKIQDRLLDFAGQYSMWRTGDQMFMVFADEKAKNDAMIVMKRFGARRGNKSDSLNANNLLKKKTQKKSSKKKHSKQQNENESASQSTSSSNKGWSHVGNASSNAIQIKKAPEVIGLKTDNRFG